MVSIQNRLVRICGWSTDQGMFLITKNSLTSSLNSVKTGLLLVPLIIQKFQCAYDHLTGKDKTRRLLCKTEKSRERAQRIFAGICKLFLTVVGTEFNCEQKGSPSQKMGSNIITINLKINLKSRFTLLWEKFSLGRKNSKSHLTGTTLL